MGGGVGWCAMGGSYCRTTMTKVDEVDDVMRQR